MVHLYAQGYTKEEIINFELSMTSPSTIYESEKITLYSSKVDLAKNMIESGLMSREWIYKNIFNFTNSEIKDIQKQVVDDSKWAFRVEKIKDEGEDIATDFFKMRKAKSEDELDQTESENTKDVPEPTGDQQKSEDANVEESTKKYSDTGDGRSSKYRKTPQVPDGGWEGAGRPKEGIKYDQHQSPRGRDVIGKHEWKNARRFVSDATLKKFNVNPKETILLSEILKK
jgi:hypothetical protein